MSELIAEARRSGRWLFSQDGEEWCFSPDELERQQAKGLFCETSRAWTFVDPIEYLKQLSARLYSAVNGPSMRREQ